MTSSSHPTTDLLPSGSGEDDQHRDGATDATDATDPAVPGLTARDLVPDTRRDHLGTDDQDEGIQAHHSGADHGGPGDRSGSDDRSGLDGTRGDDADGGDEHPDGFYDQLLDGDIDDDTDNDIDDNDIDDTDDEDTDDEDTDDDRFDAFDDGDAFDLGGLGPRPALAREEDVLEYLCDIIGPDREGPPALWVSFVDPDLRPLPVVIAVDDLPPLPDRRTIGRLVGAALLEAVEYTPEPRAVVAVVRRGGGCRAAFEARWAGAVREAASGYGLGVHAIAAVGAERCAVLGG